MENDKICSSKGLPGTNRAWFACIVNARHPFFDSDWPRRVISRRHTVELPHTGFHPADPQSARDSRPELKEASERLESLEALESSMS